jgi:hypothetical protein
MLEALALIKPIFAPSPLAAAQPKIPDYRRAPVRRTAVLPSISTDPETFAPEAKLRTAVLLATDTWDTLHGPYTPDQYRVFLARKGQREFLPHSGD